MILICKVYERNRRQLFRDLRLRGSGEIRKREISSVDVGISKELSTKNEFCSMVDFDWDCVPVLDWNSLNKQCMLLSSAMQVLDIFVLTLQTPSVSNNAHHQNYSNHPPKLPKSIENVLKQSGNDHNFTSFFVLVDDTIAFKRRERRL